MATIGMTSNLLYAFFGGSIGDRLRASPRLRRYQRYGTGAVYLGLGVTTALVNPASAGLIRTGEDPDWRSSGTRCASTAVALGIPEQHGDVYFVRGDDDQGECADA